MEQSSARTVPVESINAMRLADSIAQTIVNSHPEIQAAIAGRRICHETFESIAKAEAEALEQVHAITAAIQYSVVQRVCRMTLSETAEREAKHKVRSRAGKRRGFSKEQQENSVRATQIYPWTPEINADLLESEETILHEKGLHAHKPDWGRIASVLNEKFGTTFTAHQWMSRANNLRRARHAAPAASDSGQNEEVLE
jgi:hypothetical protein